MRICPKCSKRSAATPRFAGIAVRFWRHAGGFCGGASRRTNDSIRFSIGSQASGAGRRGRGGIAEPTPPDLEAPPWKCPQCGELVPGTFDVCWKCQTTKDGERADQSEPVFFPEIVDASRPNVESETAEFLKSLEVINGKFRHPVGLPTVRIIQNDVWRHGTGPGGRVESKFAGRRLRRPFCLDLKDRLYGELKANICGDCGHVELRVANPKELYRHYRRSNG